MTGTGKNSSTMVRRQLGRKLRALRESSGRTREDVVGARLMSLGKLKTIEHGRSIVRPGDAYELGRLYGASAEDLEILRGMAFATAQDGWWPGYGEGLVKDFDTYLYLEAFARRFHVFQPLVIYGLLQTEDYAVAVESASDLNGDEKRAREHARVRIARQTEFFARSPRPVMNVILTESALRMPVGRPDVMRAQYAHLRRIHADGKAAIQIFPTAAGPHPGLLGPFTIMDFPDPEDPAVAYMWTYLGARNTDSEAHVEQHRQVYRALLGKSVPLAEFQL